MSTTCLRSISLPILCPIDPAWTGDGTQEQRRQLWAERRTLLRRVLEQCRQASNRAMRVLARVDCAPPARGAKGLQLPKMPDVDGHELLDGKSLYLAMREVAPDLQSGSCSQLRQDLVRAYLRERLDVFRGLRSWRCYSSAPYPIRRQELESQPLVERGGPGGPLEIGIPFAGPGGKILWTRWRLRSGGRRYGRAAAGARAMARGEADLRVAYVLERKGEWFLKLVGRYPCRPDREAKGRLLVCTAPGALLRYATDRQGQEGWCRYDQIPRLMAQRRALAQRLADDMHRERRVPRRKRARMVAANDPRLERINGAIKDCLRRAAKEVVAVAVRRRCSELVYRDLLPAGDRAGRRAPWLDDAWCHGLAWHALRDRIKTLCHEQGVQYTYDSDGAAVPARWSVQDDIAEHLGEGDGGV